MRCKAFILKKKKKKKKKKRMPYSQRAGVARNMKCPHCGEDDSTGHMLNGCTLPELKAMYIERHNRAGRRIVKEITKGKHGANFTMGDVGAYGKVEHLGIRENRIPHTILSDMVRDARQAFAKS